MATFDSVRQRFMHNEYDGYSVTEKKLGYQSLQDISLSQFDVVNSLQNIKRSFDVNNARNAYDCYKQPENHMFVRWFRIELKSELPFCIDVILIQEGHSCFDVFYFMSNTTLIFCIYNDMCAQWLNIDQAVEKELWFVSKKRDHMNIRKMGHLNSLSHDLLIMQEQNEDSQ